MALLTYFENFIYTKIYLTLVMVIYIDKCYYKKKIYIYRI